MFQKIVIVGVGLIGGSIGLEIKRRKLASSVVGIGRSSKNLQLAIQRKLIDKASTDILSEMQGCDLVILCTPVQTVEKYLQLISKKIEPGTIVMDAGSTKEKIVRAAEKYLPKNVHFVGAHPIAGTEKSGAQAALADLFKGKKCLLTPRSKTPKSVIKKVELFWKSMGAIVSICGAQKHDEILSMTSHLPQLAATALIKTVGEGLEGSVFKKMAGSGLKDTTRIAASPEEMWADICVSNKKALSKALSVYEKNLARLKKMIQKEDKSALQKYFKHSADLRRKLES